MLKRFFARDRLVMAGLVILGFATVAAGFFSGRSTFQYALATDARKASAAWVEKAEFNLFIRQSRARPMRVGQHDVKIIAPDLLARFRRHAAQLDPEDIQIARSLHEETGLLAGIDLLFSSWISSLTDLLDENNHISRITHFTILDAKGRPVIRDGAMDASQLAQIIRSPLFRSEFHKALGMRTARVISDVNPLDGADAEFRKLLIIPVMEGLQVARVYTLLIDQSSAATMSKVALVAASMMTSLLIVLSYSIPAAVAFRRIRERWKAEDQIRFLAMHDPPHRAAQPGPVPAPHE
ncbi:MAG: hypothetical protein Kow0032_09800 [Methyloligellaceae bacterium]